MAVQVSYPGVYIEEFAPGAPIEGVGTSTAALIGPTERGDIELPTKITSWDRFRAEFGAEPVPGFHLWYAARGFFENGGTVAYIVRVSNGTYSHIVLNSRPREEGGEGLPLLTVRARQPGDVAIKLKVDDQHRLAADATKLYRPTGNLDGAAADRTIKLKDGAAKTFRPGDTILVGDGGMPVLVTRVSGDTLTVAARVTAADDADVRLADITPGMRTVRLVLTGVLPEGALAEGTMLTLTQGDVTDTQIVDSVQTEFIPAALAAEGEEQEPPTITYRVTFRSPLRRGFDMTADVAVQSEEFSLSITEPTGNPPLQWLSMVPSHPNYVLRKINDDPNVIITVIPANPPPAVAPPLNLPQALAETAFTAGNAEDLSTLNDGDYVRALDTLRSVDDVNLIAIPDNSSATVQGAMIDQCTQLMDRFAVLDGPAGAELFGTGNSIEQHRRQVDSARGYAGLYYPWLRVAPAFRGDPLEVPPSGHICGIISRSDQQRGVHKAPANEAVSGAFGVAMPISEVEHGELNLQGINVIRVFKDGGRPMLYGARTTATDKNWQQVNIRRLFMFLEESIQEGIRWAVFEPNNLQLWQKLRRSIGDFLNRAWRDGALFGAKAEDAYYVRIDEVLNPFSEQQLGRLNIEIGVWPVYATEFIIVRIGIWSGGSDVSES